MSKIIKSRRNCCVCGCHNSEANVEGKQPQVKFHRFPAESQNASRREQWVQWVKRKYVEDGKDWKPTDNSRICSEHFVDNKAYDSSTHAGYLPSIYPKKLLRKHPHLARRKVPTDNERWNRANKKLRIATEQELAGNQQIEDRDDLFIDVSVPNYIEPMCKDQIIQTEVSPSDHVSKPKGKLNIFISNINRQAECIKNQPPGLEYMTVSNEEINDLTEKISQLKLRQEELIRGLDLTVQVQILKDSISNLEAFGVSILKPSVITCDSSTQISHHPETVDRAVGQNENIFSFHGFSSIEQQNDRNSKALERLTAVKPQVFHFLCAVLKQSGYQPRNRRIQDFLLMFLMKLKLALTFCSLSVVFSMPLTTVRKNFYRLLNHLYLSTKDLIDWPSRKDVEACLPECFRKEFPKCRVIIDCTEFRCEKPRSIVRANALYSSYKSCHTVKVLIAANPNGNICFISDAYGGRSSDGFLTNFTGFLSKLEPGDTVLADKGFPVINADDVVTVIPPRKEKNIVQFSAEQLKETESIASRRIHIERVIQRLKIFDILSNQLPHSLLPHINKIITVCAVLVNLQNKIIKGKSSSPSNDDCEDDEDGQMGEMDHWDQETADQLQASIFRPTEQDAQIEVIACSQMQQFGFNN